MKKVFTKPIVIILITCIMWNLLLTKSLARDPDMPMSDVDPNTSLGATSGHSVKEAGETLAAWALNFCNLHAGQCSYYGTPKSYDEPVSDDDLTTQYHFDCVRFVTFAIHHALGLDANQFVCCPGNGSGGTNKSYPNHLVENGFERVDCASSEWQPGDVIVMWHHVAIYVGDGKTVGMWQDGNNGGMKVRDALKDCSDNGGYQGWVGRISADAAANAVFEYMVGAGTGGVEGLDGSTTSSGVEVDTAIVDLDEIADKFDFSGMATTVIKEDQKADVFSWFFEGIGGFVDYLAGIILTIAIKAPILGYTNTILNLINSFLHGLN